MMKRILVATLMLSLSISAEAKQHRSSAVKAQFQRTHPCPSTGGVHGKCPGYIKDHIVPLCAGGSDSPYNMQWQTVADAKAKDRLERRQCTRRR